MPDLGTDGLDKERNHWMVDADKVAMQPGTSQRMRKGSDIAERLIELAVGALRVSANLPKHAAGRHVALQLARSSTGGGANYEEARAAESRADFIHKVGLAAKEVRETAFWFEVILRSQWKTSEAPGLLKESQELAAILAASGRTARTNAEQRRG